MRVCLGAPISVGSGELGWQGSCAMGVTNRVGLLSLLLWELVRVKERYHPHPLNTPMSQTWAVNV